MLRLRPYKPCDAEIITSWCKDELTMRKWTSDRYEKFPITAEDMNHKYIDCNGDCDDADNFYPMTAFDETGLVGKGQHERFIIDNEKFMEKVQAKLKQ